MKMIDLEVGGVEMIVLRGHKHTIIIVEIEILMNMMRGEHRICHVEIQIVNAETKEDSIDQNPREIELIDDLAIKYAICTIDSIIIN